MPEIDLNQIKIAIADANRGFEEFKKVQDERFKELEQKGSADVLFGEQIAKIQDDILAAQKAADEAHLAIRRSHRLRVDNDGKEIDLDKKAWEWSRQAALDTKAPAASFTHDDMKEYTEAFKSLMRKNFDRDLLSDAERKTLSVGQDSAGGYFVYPDLTGRIVQKVYETTPIRAYASVQTISTDALEGYYDNDEIGYGWVAELVARPATSTPTVGKWRIPVHEMYAMPDASQSALDDASIDLEEWLDGKIVDKFARVENAASVNGTGVDQWRGFATYPNGTDLTNSIERFITGVDGGFAADPDGTDKLVEMIYGLKAQYRRQAVWAMNSTTIGTVMNLKDSNGDRLWQPSIAAGQPSTLHGYGVAAFEDMEDIATDSLPIAFGDFRAAYQIVDRVGIRMLRDPYSAKPKVQFYATKRSGGDMINGEALKFLEFTA